MPSRPYRWIRPALIVAAIGCASGSPSIPRWSPDTEVPLSVESTRQIQLAAVRHIRRSEQQIMCIGVMPAREFGGAASSMAVAPPEVLLRQLGTRNLFRPYSECGPMERGPASSSYPRIATIPDRRPATQIVLGTPFGLSEGRAVINLSERSQRASARHRCEARRAPGGAWEIVDCLRERG